MSRSRVAPMRTATILRLELCGALLLSELVVEIQAELSTINIKFDSSDIVLWTDSSVVLGWIQSVVLLKSFVANRITQILENTEAKMWRHVPTSSNPADLITRGTNADTLADPNHIWWNGPSWITNTEDSWAAEIPVHPIKLALLVTHGEANWIIDRCSNWRKLMRVTGYVLRFVFNCKIPKLKKYDRRLGSLSIAKLDASQLFWLLRFQIQDFSSEISSLTRGNKVDRRSCLKSLNPFLDDHKVIRVGGRLAYAPIPENQKCPIVLSSKNPIVKMLFQYEHIRLLHIGPQELLAHVHRTYWPIRGRSLTRQTVHKCIICFRSKPLMLQPVMAPLPSVCVTRCRAFEKAGVDLCGPINIRSGLRKVTPLKHYIAVFVCMATRAIHLELVRDLSSDAFMSALFRFIAHRGQCAKLYSDNGTNFIGAKKILSSWAFDLSKENKFNDQLSELGIEWQFIPPSAPHFGGLWESAVKSAKQHLVKSSNGALLTYEEFSTLLCRIEAVLNSMPLTAMSSDPSDFTALTPGHFLIVCPMTSPPEPNVLDIPENRLRKFQLMQARLQHFWKRWSSEYLPQLQRRDRWISNKSENISVDELAILKQDNIPPLQWQMVQVIKVCPGADGVVRVVTVWKAAGAEYVRPVRKLACLPNQDCEDAED